MSIAKKSIISGLVWIRGSLGEDQPTFQVVVNKPITLAQGEKIAMLLKQSIDEARAKLVTANKPTDADPCVVHDREPSDDTMKPKKQI